MVRMWPFDYEDPVITFLRLFQLATVAGALGILVAIAF
jgi:hypothetical protein